MREGWMGYRNRNLAIVIGVKVAPGDIRYVGR
jgi:hypothetical protein